MIVYYSNGINSEDPSHKLDFSFAENELNNVFLHISGANSPINQDFIHYNLNFELPNMWILPQTRELLYEEEKKYKKIFTISPDTVKKRNDFLQKELYEYVFFPFSKKYIPQYTQKLYDIIFTGNYGISFFPWLQKINWNSENNIIVGNRNDNAKYKNISYLEKIKLTALSKISICYNNIPLNLLQYTEYYEGLNNFPEIDKVLEIRNSEMTQHKARIIEAAVSKTIILCKEDSFNIIEDFYEKDKDFIYFNENNLVEIIDDILKNYEKYQYLIDNAYNKVINNYTTNHFYEKYIKNKEL